MSLKKKLNVLIGEDLVFGDIIFLPIFVALYFTYLFFHNSTFPLEQFHGRSISLATSEGIDIVQRVSSYYRGIAVFFVLAVAFCYSMLRFRKNISLSDLRLFNLISVAGTCLMFFKLMGASVETSLHLVISLLFATFTGIVGKRILNWKEKEEGEYLIVFGWLFLISVILYFLQWHLLQLFSGFYIHSIPDFTGVVTAGFLIIYFIISNKYTFTSSGVSRMIRISRPLIFIPLFSLLAFEISMILNQRGIFTGPGPLFIAGLLYLSFRIFRLSKNTSLRVPDSEALLGSSWVPWILAGITGLILYKPVVAPEIDWFEDGNRILPLQQWFDFGKIPFLDTFSSHALSDWGWGALYSLLNGADPLGGFVYSFLMAAIITVLVYTLVLRISGSIVLAVFVVFFYPYSDFLIPSYYQLVPLTVLLLLNLYHKQTTKNYLSYFSLLFFMMVWRIDLGISNFIAGISGLALLWFVLPDFVTDWKSVRKGFVWFAAGALVLFFAALLIRGPSLLFERIGEMLGYLSSLQAYGLKDLTSAKDMKYYNLYFVMPAAVAIVAGYAFFRMLRKTNPSSRESIISIAILFLSIFYFSNLQRGLVRHTLAEQWDAALTSYGFFILVCPFLYPNRKNSSAAIQFFGFFVLATVITANYKLNSPETDRNNLYHEVSQFVQRPLPVTTNGKTDRTIENANYKSGSYGDLDLWMKQHLSGSSTFLDFSNTPMLYYFLNRKTPNYLCQIPHTAHNDEMQDRLLNGLSEYNLPVVLFSNYPVTYWDQLDGIPNSMRHYKISEYIYKNYTPYAVINHHSVWVKKGEKFPPLKVSTKINYNDLKNLTLHGAVLTDSISLRITGAPAELDNILKEPVHLDSSKKYFVYFNGWFENQGTIAFVPNFNNSGFDMGRRSESRVYSGPSKAFFLIEPRPGETELSGLKIILPKDGSMSLASLQLNACDIVPDLVSELPVEYALKNIPYIWGQYDDAWKQGRIGAPLSLLKETTTLNNGQGVMLSIPAHHPDSEYTYIRLSARAKSDNTTDMILRFGKDHETQGSYIFTIRPSGTQEDYLVRMSTLYNWTRKDHTWITLYAMNGDAEIEIVELRKGEQ
ncbi:MAG TPA: hypothetical protein PLU53_01100 [Bacteroidia bacterium]|nr:hypothetical protein [Bacteroidia bacterium]